LLSDCVPIKPKAVDIPKSTFVELFVFVNRNVLLPALDICKLVAGLVVPIPTFVPLSKMILSPIVVAPVNLAT
jgi:hypothetical protein